MNRYLLRLSLLTVLLVVALPVSCGRDRSRPLVTLPHDGPLAPPVLLDRAPGAGLVAIVSEGAQRGLALWRADSLGTQWRHWTALGHGGISGTVDLAVAGTFAVAAGAEGPRIWIARAPLEAPTPEGKPDVAFIETEKPVVSLAIDARPSEETAGEPVLVHLVYLTRAAGDTLSTLTYRRSMDAGAAWSEPTILATGALGRPAVFARSDRAGQVDACYPRDGFLAWRGSGNRGEEWSAERAIRVKPSPGARTGVSRTGNDVLVLCESETHQVVASVSSNNGYNWEPAMALARQCDHLRLPSVDRAEDLLWIGYSQGDSLVVVRATGDAQFPKLWFPGIAAAAECCLDAPAIAALPDSSVGVLFAVPAGKVHFARIRQAREVPTDGE